MFREYNLLLLGKDDVIVNSVKKKIELLSDEHYSFQVKCENNLVSIEADLIVLVVSQRIQSFRQLIRKIKKEMPNCKILLLGNYSKNDFIKEVQNEGAHDMLPVNSSIEELKLTLIQLLDSR